MALSSSLCSSFQYVIIVKIIRSWKVLCILRYVPGFFLKKKVKIKNLFILLHHFSIFVNKVFKYPGYIEIRKQDILHIESVQICKLK